MGTLHPNRLIPVAVCPTRKSRKGEIRALDNFPLFQTGEKTVRIPTTTFRVATRQVVTYNFVLIAVLQTPHPCHLSAIFVSAARAHVDQRGSRDLLAGFELIRHANYLNASMARIARSRSRSRPFAAAHCLFSSARRQINLRMRVVFIVPPIQLLEN